MPPLGRLIRILVASLLYQLIFLSGVDGQAASLADSPTGNTSRLNPNLAESSLALVFAASASGRVALGQDTLWYLPETQPGAEHVLQALVPESGELKRSYHVAHVEEILAVIGDTCVVSDDFGQLRAFATRDSDPVWTYYGPNTEVILGADANSLFGVAIGNIAGEIKQIVVAIDIDSGKEMWRSPLTNDPFHSSPTTIRGFVAGGVIAVWITDEGIVSVLNAGTGSLLWEVAASGLVPSVEPAAHGQIYVIDETQTVRARDVLTGRSAWSFPIKNVTYASGARPIFAAGDIVIGAYATPTSILEMDKGMFFRLVAIDAATGAMRWEYPTDDWLQGEATFSADDQTIYASVQAGRVDSRILALDKTTGDTRWTSSQHAPYRPVTVSDGTVLLATQDGRAEVLALDADDGGSAWRKSLPSSGAGVIDDPTVRDGLVYLNADGLLALRLSNGRQAWSAGTDTGDGADLRDSGRRESVLIAGVVVATIVVVAAIVVRHPGRRPAQRIHG